MHAHARIRGRMRRVAAAMALGLALAGCETTAPDFHGTAQLAIAPVFPAATLAAIEIREAQVVLRRLNGTVVVEQTIPVEPGALDIELTVELVVQGAAEDFNLSLVLLDEDGRELYRPADDPQRITIGATGETPPISVPMRYTGPGATVQTLEITGSEVPLTPLTPVTLQGQPRDALGNLVSDAPISWRTGDPEHGDLVELEVGTSQNVTVRLTGEPPLPVSIDIVGELPRVLEGVDPVAATASLDVEELFGRYDLIMVEGEPLPWLAPNGDLLLSAVLQVNADLTWMAEFVYEIESETTVDTSGGTYSISGAQITFVNPDGGASTWVLSDGQLVLGENVLVFQRTQEFVGVIVAGTGDGAGIVTSAPSGINCTIDAGQTSGVCQADFGRGQIVRLEAVPQPGSSFSFWSPECGESPICDVTLDQSKTLTVRFVRNFYQLTVSGAGAGSGTITGQGGININCAWDGSSNSGTCSASFVRGTLVTLIATPGEASSFTGWSGGCSGTGQCNVTMTQDTSVIASFIPNAPPVLSNMRYELVELNAEQFCAIQQPPGSWFRVFVDYTDVNGDVTPGLAVLRDSSSAFATVTVTLPGTDPATNLDYTLSGSGFEGTITLTNLCLRFGNLNSVTKYWTLWDAAGMQSNTDTVTIVRPAGANVVMPGVTSLLKGGQRSNGS